MTTRRLTRLLGLCLPLSGGLPLSQWIPGYPDQLTPIRLVTLACLTWLVSLSRVRPLPAASQRMILVLLGVFAYATLSLIWAPDNNHAMHDLITVGMALATAIALLLLVRSDVRALAAFAQGVLISGGLQVVVAAFEVTTGYHPGVWFGGSLVVAEYGLANIEEVTGPVAWGTMGDPNDLGGFWLLVTAVFLTAGAFGFRMRRAQVVMGGATVAASIAIGLTSMADARAYRLGLVALLGMYVIDRLLVPGRSALRAPVMLILGWGTWALTLMVGGAILRAINETSDSMRLELIAAGFGGALRSGGFGLGLGAEKAMIDSGEIPLNFHNIFARLAAELGLLPVAIFGAYLLWLIVSWAFTTHSARVIGNKAALARASVAVVLLIYGVTASGALDSPTYWTFFAVTTLVSGVNGAFAKQDIQPAFERNGRPSVASPSLWSGRS